MSVYEAANHTFQRTDKMTILQPSRTLLFYGVAKRHSQVMEESVRGWVFLDIKDISWVATLLWMNSMRPVRSKHCHKNVEWYLDVSTIISECHLGFSFCVSEESCSHGESGELIWSNFYSLWNFQQRQKLICIRRWNGANLSSHHFSLLIWYTCTLLLPDLIQEFLIRTTTSHL